MSLILSINAGINSSVGLFKNGVPVICIEEERFNRIKNWFGFPEQALDHLLKKGYVHPEEITTIAICDELTSNANRERFYARYENHYNKGKELAYNINLERTKLDVKNKIKSTGIYQSYKQSVEEKNNPEQYNQQLHQRLGLLGFDTNKIVHVAHHLCHAASAYYGLAKHIDEPYLIFTLDGGGDNVRSTVSIGAKGNIEQKTVSNEYSVGNIYSAITHHLGFRSHEHEYKLMGLAPYVNPDYAEKYCKFFEQYLFLENDDTTFANPEFINHSIFFAAVIKEFGNSRFDNIAAGLQAFAEDIVVRWVKGNVKKYGISNILCSGGVFMNVKLNMLLSQLPEVSFIDVFPSCGDESNIFGAAFHIHNLQEQKSVGLLKAYTLGTNTGDDLQGALALYKDKIQVTEAQDVNTIVAQLLSENNIVARCSGSMEFGARALGNRSVLANPAHMQNINKINRSVKKRDFWMPFAPAMLADKAESMITIPASLREQGSPYMMFAFDTVAESRDSIVCGVHQADFTARAQMVTKEIYPDFYDLIQKFEQITGIPCVLNTSFNLHGYPIVTNSAQAIEVFLQSAIDVLVIDNFIIRRQ